MKIILTFLIGIIIGIIGFQTYYNIDNSIPDGLADKYKVCPKCESVNWLACKDCEGITNPNTPKCYPFKECDVSIEKANVYLDTKPYLDLIKALNFDIADLKASNKDLKSCISKECLNFSSMPSKCN